MSILYKRILVPLDGSDLAKTALPYAQAMVEQSANPLDTELRLLRVVSLITPRKYIEKHTFLDQPRLDEENLNKVDEAALWLQALVDDLRLHHIQADSSVDVGDAAEKIVAYAKANQVDLIVMSTHGRTGVRKLVAGSIASEVSTSAPCPVLLVRSHP